MSSPSSSIASLDSTLVESPKLGDLSLKDIVVSAEAKVEAAAFKEQANEAFKSPHPFVVIVVRLETDWG